MQMKKVPITIAQGDGIGPEIMAASLRLLEAAGAELEIHEIEVGEKVYMQGQSGGIDPAAWDLIKQTKAFLKAPITTPQGGGFKSLNVTIRTTLGLYANIRPCVSYYPFVETKHPKMDVVIVRENEEDLYTGIEYRQTHEEYHALKIITRPGCEKIIRYAFEYAEMYKRKKVTCFTKDNILKLTDGLFHKIFEEIGKEFPDIEKEHWIVDIGAAKLADTPEAFDVIVLPNLYGDILSDVAAQIAGSVGLAGSANIGTNGAMFEAIHGSAPKRAGQNVANPSGLILASVMMLVYLNQTHSASLIHNAWLKTLEEGIHTYDIYKEKTSRKKVGTKEFADAVIARLGQNPDILSRVSYTETKHVKPAQTKFISKKEKKELVGVDIFIQWERSADELAAQLNQFPSTLKLKMIGNRGVKVWPNQHPDTLCIDSWRCRFMHPEKNEIILPQHILEILQELEKKNIEVVQTQYLFNFDRVPGYTLS